MADKDSMDRSGSEGSMEMVDSAHLVELQNKSPEDVLRDHRLWEGWGQYYDTIPLAPGRELQLPSKEENDPEVVGFAFPLPPVEYAHRNERKFPPPGDEEMYMEMFKLLNHSLKMKLFKRSYVLAVVYGHINRNKRDSEGWQRAFIKAGGISRLFDIWRNPEKEDDAKTLTDKYWVMAIIGRMMGTSTESRTRLINDNAVQFVLEGTKDSDDDIRECSMCALKGLITHPEGRKVITYSMLIECLGGRM